MKRFILIASLVAIAASEPTTVTKVQATLTIVERSELQTEIPQPDGMTKKQVFEIFQDRILQCTFDGEKIYATNTIDTGRATIKLVPEDSRRAR